jgi:hypothetical protein
MLMKILQKVDKFYFIFIITLIAMGILVVFAFRTDFSAISNSYDITSQVTESDLRIDKDKLDKAIGMFDNRTIVPLEIR